MLFGLYTYKTRWNLLGFVLMIPLSVFAATDDQQLITAKDEFNQLWHAAAATTQKRDTLEQTLANFDSKVANAKQDLERASKQRKIIREGVNERLAFIEALQGQLQAADEAKAFYDAVALGQQEDLVHFLRYMSSKNIALTESGPAAGGPLLKHVIRGSLGDSIDDELALDAVMKARTQFMGQVRVLLQESDRVRERLTTVANNYAAELKYLEEMQRNITSIVDTKKQFIDDSWKQKKLTEEELQAVAHEASEANARIQLMQKSLVEINEELKKAKLTKIQQQLAPLQTQKKEWEDQLDTLERRDTAMRLIEDEATKAFQAAIASKNSDKKLYQKIELKKLRRFNASAELLELQSQKTLSGITTVDTAITALTAEIALIDEVLPYMRDGISGDLAEAYIVAKHVADNASRERATIAQQKSELGISLADTKKHILAKTKEIDAAMQQYELDAEMVPLFQWPVSGVITAGYLDTSYVAVFGVPHRAIDIAVPQSTPVRSIADGVVFAIHDGGRTGYSYVLIGHRNGYASLYGHVSSTLVKSGDLVTIGQIIALSGGRPGTRGAGYMTTGAHLHLEVTNNGAHVNPASVLPAR